MGEKKKIKDRDARYRTNNIFNWTRKTKKEKGKKKKKKEEEEEVQLLELGHIYLPSNQRP